MPALTGSKVAAWPLIQWKHAIRLEQAGMRHSSGRSVRKFAALNLGLAANAKPEAVLAVIEERLAAIRAE